MRARLTAIGTLELTPEDEIDFWFLTQMGKHGISKNDMLTNRGGHLVVTRMDLYPRYSSVRKEDEATNAAPGT